MSQVPSHPDQDLLSKVGGQGFPHFVIMDEEGTVLNSFYPKGVADMEQARTSSEGSEYLKAKKAFRANPSDSKLQEDFFKKAFELIPGEALLKEASALAEAGKLSPEIAKQVKARLAESKVGEVFQGIAAQFEGKQPSRDEVLAYLGPKMYELYQQGFIPSDQSGVGVDYWYCLLFHAEKEKNITAFEEGASALKRILGGNGNNPQVATLLKEVDERLANLKK